MLNSLFLLIVAVSILFILFFAFMTKNKLASYVSYTILASIAITMALNGMAGIIADVDFLSFLVRFFQFLSDIIVYIELGLIVFLLFFSKHKSKNMLLKVAIIVYVIFTLLLTFNLF